MWWGTPIALVAFLLSGCDGSRSWTRDEIRAIAEENEPFEGGNTALTMQHDADIKEMQRKIDMLQTQIDAVGSAHDSLTNTFNKNVQQENAQRVRVLTANGYCGREWVTFPDGSGTWRNKECTLKDLK